MNILSNNLSFLKLNLSLDNFCLISNLVLIIGMYLPHWLIITEANTYFLYIVIIICLTLKLYLIPDSKILLYCLIIILSYSYINYWQQQIMQTQTIVQQYRELDTNIQIEKINHIDQQQKFQTVIAKTELTNKKIIRLQLSWQQQDGDEQVKIGDVWYVHLKLKPINSVLNQAGFNQEKWLIANHIDGKASVAQAIKLKSSNNLRTTLINYYIQHYSSLKNFGMLMALTFGERGYLTTEKYAVYQQTNTAHIIAISGLHIGIAFMLGYAVANQMRRLHNTLLHSLYLPIICGFIFSLSYSWLAGFTPTTLRAITALTILWGFRIARIPISSYQLILRTVCLLLYFDPLLALNISFILSVLAVSTLLLFQQLLPLDLIRLYGATIYQHIQNIIAKYIIQLLHLQLGFLICFTPIVNLIFNGFSYLSLFTNLIIVSLFSLLIIPLVLFSLFTANVCSSLTLVDNLISCSNQTLSYFHNTWYATSARENYMLNLISIAIICCLLITLHLKTYRKTINKQAPKNLVNKLTLTMFTVNLDKVLSYQQIKIWLICCIIFMITNLSYLTNSYLIKDQKNQWQIDFFDVGQGLAVMISKQQHAILYDTGIAWSSGSYAKTEILPYLQQQALQLDYLILSHDHWDHIGGVPNVIAKYPNVKIFSPSNYLHNHMQLNTSACIMGKTWQWQQLTITSYAPPHIIAQAGNDDSCVISISDGKNIVLLMGDAEKNTELAISPKLPSNVDILQVGHHGSITSSSWALLNHIQPKISVISAGRYNPWRHPHPNVLARLQKLQSNIYQTTNTGQISFILQKEQAIRTKLRRNHFSPWYNTLLIP